MNNTMTILEATKKWVGEFNAINQSLISRLMKHDIDGWMELTKASVGEYVSVYGQAKNVDTNEFEHISGTYTIEALNVDTDTVFISVDSVSYEVELNECDVERDSYLPMWGTMWSFSESLDESWAMENLQAMSDCGFRIYEDYETGDLYFGIDGMGYDFYEAHWIPLYKARGLQWHKVSEDEMLERLLKEIELDEHEYCFDTSYCSDESWKEQHGNKTRKEGYEESMTWHKTQSLKQLMEFYGDKYNYLLEEYNYKIK